MTNVAGIYVAQSNRKIIVYVELTVYGNGTISKVHGQHKFLKVLLLLCLLNFGEKNSEYTLFSVFISKLLSKYESAGAEVTSTMRENVDSYITKTTKTPWMLTKGGLQPAYQEPLGGTYMFH